ncbi:hypothetical protein [Oceanobacillus sp. CF4.6]|uniref:hypothetical protein n=1 Tax=Oceanobacillus sp. CF4.6 TaxID=3373080 RepID=UPI003EE4BA04
MTSYFNAFPQAEAEEVLAGNDYCNYDFLEKAEDELGRLYIFQNIEGERLSINADTDTLKGSLVK